MELKISSVFLHSQQMDRTHYMQTPCVSAKLYRLNMECIVTVLLQKAALLLLMQQQAHVRAKFRWVAESSAASAVFKNRLKAALWQIIWIGPTVLEEELFNPFLSMQILPPTPHGCILIVEIVWEVGRHHHLYREMNMLENHFSPNLNHPSPLSSCF